MEEKGFLDRVLEYIPRATRRERRDIRAELEGHIEDHALALEEGGYSPEEAKARAEESMGDAKEIGEALNRQLSGFWLGVQTAAQGVVAILLALALCQVDWEAQFALIRQNRMARRREVTWGTYYADGPYLRWDSGEEMWVGDSVVRLEGAVADSYLASKEDNLCILTFHTYREQVWKSAQCEIFEHIRVTPEGGEEREGRYYYNSKGGYGIGEYYFWGLPAETSYVDVVYDYLGERVEMRCQIEWEEQVWDGKES